MKDALKEPDKTIALDLSNSDFHFLPDNIKMLNKLKYIKLRNCRNLNLDNTFIKLADLKELTHLDISLSYHQKIPQTINKLKSLEFLDLSHNQLMQISNEIS